MTAEGGAPPGDQAAVVECVAGAAAVAVIAAIIPVGIEALGRHAGPPTSSQRRGRVCTSRHTAITEALPAGWRFRRPATHAADGMGAPADTDSVVDHFQGPGGVEGVGVRSTPRRRTWLPTRQDHPAPPLRIHAGESATNSRPSRSAEYPAGLLGVQCPPQRIPGGTRGHHPVAPRSCSHPKTGQDDHRQTHAAFRKVLASIRLPASPASQSEPAYAGHALNPATAPSRAAQPARPSFTARPRTRLRLTVEGDGDIDEQRDEQSASDPARAPGSGRARRRLLVGHHHPSSAAPARSPAPAASAPAAAPIFTSRQYRLHRGPARGLDRRAGNAAVGRTGAPGEEDSVVDLLRTRRPSRGAGRTRHQPRRTWGPSRKRPAGPPPPRIRARRSRNPTRRSRSVEHPPGYSACTARRGAASWWRPARSAMHHGTAFVFASQNPAGCTPTTAPPSANSPGRHSGFSSKAPHHQWSSQLDRERIRRAVSPDLEPGWSGCLQLFRSRRPPRAS